MSVDGDMYGQLGLTGTREMFQPSSGSRKKIHMFQQMYRTFEHN